MPTTDDILAVILGGGKGARLIPPHKAALQTGSSHCRKISLNRHSVE